MTERNYYHRLYDDIVRNGGTPGFDPDDPEMRSKVEAEARRLIARGYYQVSRAFLTLAKLPEGLTGVEALGRASGEPAWAQHLGELGAGDYYLRCYAKETVKISPLVFEAFRKLGGGSYMSRPDPPKTEAEQLRDCKRSLEATTSRCLALEQQRAIPAVNYRDLELRAMQKMLEAAAERYLADPRLDEFLARGMPRYSPHPTAVEFVGHSLEGLYERGYGDADDLAALRAAQLRKQGEEVSIRVVYGIEPQCSFVVLVHEDGTFENPSAGAESLRRDVVDKAVEWLRTVESDEAPQMAVDEALYNLKRAARKLRGT